MLFYYIQTQALNQPWEEFTLLFEISDAKTLPKARERTQGWSFPQGWILSWGDVFVSLQRMMLQYQTLSISSQLAQLPGAPSSGCVCNCQRNDGRISEEAFVQPNSRPMITWTGSNHGMRIWLWAARTWGELWCQRESVKKFLRGG